MQRLLAILLLGLFGLPFALPLLAQAQTPESRLPACCRKGGDHHCMGNMSMQEMAESQISPNPRFDTVTPKCPYAPAAVSLHADLVLPLIAADSLASPLAHPLLAARNARMQQVAQDRSRPKRGPPQLA